MTKLPNYGARYRTKDDFEITTFITRSEGIRAIASGGHFGRVAVPIKLLELSDLKRLLSDAKTRIDAIK